MFLCVFFTYLLSVSLRCISLFVAKSFCWTLRLACNNQTVSSSKGTFTLIPDLTLNTI